NAPLPWPEEDAEARVAAERQVAEERLARAAAERQAEEEKLARAAAERQAEAERLARAAAEQRTRAPEEGRARLRPGEPGRQASRSAQAVEIPLCADPPERRDAASAPSAVIAALSAMTATLVRGHRRPARSDVDPGPRSPPPCPQ